MRRYLIRLENSRKYIPRETIRAIIDLRKIVEPFGNVVKNLRITTNAIEFDLYCTDEVSKGNSLNALVSGLGNLLSEKDLQVAGDYEASYSIYHDKARTVDLCIELFNEERYWECHETLEQIWRSELKGREKDVQQGIILAASALVHFKKDEIDVCLRMIPRALEKLASWSDSKYYNLDVDRLRQDLNRILATRKVAPFKI